MRSWRSPGRWGFSAAASDKTAGRLGEPPPTGLPHLAEMVSAAARPGTDYADAFDFGLDLILDALERRIVSAF